MIVAPNSPSPRARQIASPAASPPRASGSVTRKNVRERARAERARGRDQVRVDRLERRDRLADVERAGDERDREDDRGLVERRR